jgi:hypothetical protein
MRHCLIICALLTSGCAKALPEPLQPYIPADLLMPCLTPAMASETEGQFARKALRIAQDRDCANGKILAIGEIVAGPQ